jgi:hypothetical protein
MSSQQPQDETMTQDADAGLLHRVVLTAAIFVLAGYLMHRLARIEAVIQNLLVVAQSDDRRLSELEGKR